MSQFSSSNANNLEKSLKQCVDERREEECSTGEDYELGLIKYNEGVSADQIRENVRRSEWNSNELGLLAAIGSKSVQETRLESCPLSIPRQPPFPTQYADGRYNSNDALVLSQRGPLPFSNDLTINSGTLQGQARDNASLLRSQLLLGSLIRHWSSRGIYDMMRSSSIALGYTPRTRNIITPQLAQPSSSPIEENVSRMGIDLLRQYYEQSVLIVQLLDRGLESGPFSLRITSGRNDQGILLLGQSSMFNAADLHDRYEDMRVDVENMSYEELLDLEDRIGDVSTGISDEMIEEHLKQRKYFILLDEKALKESCTICQEDYVEEDDLGSLECGHEFHCSCLKQWLRCKNVCPICKSTGLIVGPRM